MAASGIYFAIFYEVPDHAFEKAAWTWAIEETGGTSSATTSTLIQPCRTVGDFSTAWNAVLSHAKELSLPVIRGNLLTHASKGSKDDGLEFKGGTLSRTGIGSLPQLPWAEDGVLTLAGCNTGVMGTRGWTPAQVLATSQKVKTIGQAGYGYFSTDKYTYVEHNGTPPSTLYLWAYRRGRNSGWFDGDGRRMPGVTFQ